MKARSVSPTSNIFATFSANESCTPLSHTAERAYAHSETSSWPQTFRICGCGPTFIVSYGRRCWDLTHEPACEALGHRARVALSLATVRLRKRIRARLQGARRHDRDRDHHGDVGSGRSGGAPRALQGREHLRSLDPRRAQAPRSRDASGPRACALCPSDPQVAPRPRVGRAGGNGSRVHGEVHARRPAAPARRGRLLQGQPAHSRRPRARPLALRHRQVLCAHRASEGARGPLGEGAGRDARTPRESLPRGEARLRTC